MLAPFPIPFFYKNAKNGGNQGFLGGLEPQNVCKMPKKPRISAVFTTFVGTLFGIYIKNLEFATYYI